MTTATLEIQSSNRFPLFQRSNFYSEPYPCGLELDLETGVLSPFCQTVIDPVIDGAINGTKVRFEASPWLTSEKLNALFARHKDLFQAVLEDSTIEQKIGVLTGKASDLVLKWQKRRYGFNEADLSVLLDACELMVHTPMPKTVTELYTIVSNFLGLHNAITFDNGKLGFYQTTPTFESIYADVLKFVADCICHGEAVSSEIAECLEAL